MRNIPENAWDVKELHKRADRDYYSLDAYDALFKMFEESGLDEYDVIAWCCDFDELSLEDAKKYYYYDLIDLVEFDADEDEIKEVFELYLDDHHFYYKLDNGNYLIQTC